LGLKTVLDKLAEDIRLDPFSLLFPAAPVTPEETTRASAPTKIPIPAAQPPSISIPLQQVCAVYDFMAPAAHSP